MNIKDYCLKITDVVINIRTLFDIETKCESINFICDKNEKKDVIIDFIEIDKAENMSGDLIYHGIHGLFLLIEINTKWNIYLEMKVILNIQKVS